MNHGYISDSLCKFQKKGNIFVLRSQSIPSTVTTKSGSKGSARVHSTHTHTRRRVNRWRGNKQITKPRGIRGAGGLLGTGVLHPTHTYTIGDYSWLYGLGSRTLKLLLRQLIGQRIKLVLGRFVCHSQSSDSDSDSVWDSVLTAKSTVLSAQCSAAPWKLESGETSLLRCGLALLYLLSLADPTKKGIHRIWEICLSSRPLCEWVLVLVFVSVGLPFDAIAILSSSPPSLLRFLRLVTCVVLKWGFHFRFFGFFGFRFVFLGIFVLCLLSGCFCTVSKVAREWKPGGPRWPEIGARNDAN